MHRRTLIIFLFVLLLQTSLLSNDLNLNTLITKAKETNKHLLVLLGQTGCPYCKKMKKFILNDPDVAPFLKENLLFEYVDIKKNGEVKYKNFIGTKRKFALHVGHRFYPSTIFIDGNGNIVHEQPGVIRKAVFMNILEFIKRKSYNKSSFDDYMSEKEFEEDL